MKLLKKLSWLQIIALILVPIAAYAVAWSMNGFSAPRNFREAASALGLRVTQVCRPNNARYGARTSLHKRCLAMDLGKETPASKIAGLRKFGLCGQFHRKGYYGATADHWHVSSCSTRESRVTARRDQRGRAQNIREQNRRRSNRGASHRDRGSYDNWSERAYGTR